MIRGRTTGAGTGVRHISPTSAAYRVCDDSATCAMYFGLSCVHAVSSSESRDVSFQQIRTPASPFPPVGAVAAPCGSPAVPHLRRYYRVVRLLPHPSVLPPVDPWLHVPPDPFPEAVLLVWEEMGSSLRFLGHPCGACPGLGTPASRPDLANNGRCRMLPFAGLTASASQR